MKRRLLTLFALATALAALCAVPARAGTPATTAPVIAVEVGPSQGTGPWIGWYDGPVAVTLRASASSDIATLSYSLSGSQAGSGSVNGSTLTLRIEAEGSTLISITATARDNSSATAKYGVGVDVTNPVLTVGGVTNHDVLDVGKSYPLQFSCDDPGGAIVSCAATDNGVPITSGSSIDTSQPGSRRLVVTTTDRVRRVATRTINVEVVRPLRVVGQPVIEGAPANAKVGHQLRVSGGVFDPAPSTSFGYTWIVDGERVGRGPVFAPRPELLGKRVSVYAWGWVPGYRETQTDRVGDLLVEPGPLQVSRQPGIEGDPATARPGDRLRIVKAEITPEPHSVTYRWYADDEQVGDGEFYTVHPTDVGKTIAVDLVAIAQRTGYLDVTSDRSGAVWVVPPALEVDSPPQVSGAARVGGTLTLADGTVAPSAAPAASRWVIDGDTVATGNQLILTRAQLGRTLSCHQVFTKTGYADLTVPCAFPGGAGSVTIADAPTDGPDPGSDAAWTVKTGAGLKGKAQTGKRLRAVLPQLTGPAASYSYQWLRGGKPIKKATTATYRIRKADRGRRLSVRVTASAPGRTDLVSVSPAKRVRV
ncbi:hypothetical protein [Nocardioides sp. BYT-33-1]|uniref:hypothetical protein n=1 Tax=Nocardioides sp. BYT-33-1 TaxID=3416952 RepID=UPI003F533982